MWQLRSAEREATLSGSDVSGAVADDNRTLAEREPYEGQMYEKD